MRFGPYEALKARGYDPISEPALRAQLTSLYEDAQPNVLASFDIDQAFSQDLVMPFLLENFRLNESSEWVLKDSPSFDWQADLATLATFRPYTRERFTLPALRAAMDQVRDVMEEIE